MEDIKKLFISFLAKSFGMDDAAVTALVFDQEGNAKPDAIDILTTKEAERVKKLKGKSADPKALQAALEAERAKVLSEVIEHVKTVLPDFSSDKEGLEFFDDLVTIKRDPASKEITEDDVLRSKPYRDALSKHGMELKKVNKEWETKFNQRESEIKEAQTLQLVQKAALNKFKALNPVLPEDAARAEKQIKRLFLDELAANGVKFQVDDEDGKQKITVLDKDGKPLVNDLGHAVEFDSYISAIAESGFTFAASNPKDAAGNPNGAGAGNQGGNDKSKKFTGYRLTKPTSDDDWIRRQAEIETDSDLKPTEKTELIQKLQALHLGTATATA